MSNRPSDYAKKRASELTRAPLQCTFVAELGATPDEVFGWITDFERLPQWMPLMKRAWVDNSHAEEPGRVGAVRMIDSGFGAPTQERVVAFEPGKLLAYGASDESLMGMFTDHLGVICVEPRASGGTAFTWLCYGHPGSGLRGLAGGLVFKLVVGKSVANLRKRYPA